MVFYVLILLVYFVVVYFVGLIFFGMFCLVMIEEKSVMFYFEKMKGLILIEWMIILNGWMNGISISNLLF